MPRCLLTLLVTISLVTACSPGVNAQPRNTPKYTLQYRTFRAGLIPGCSNLILKQALSMSGKSVC